jgi:hypothetical protein
MGRLADLVLAVHFAYVLFVVGGLLSIWLGYALGWRWVRYWWFRVLHFAAIGIVAIEALVGVICPLTWLEDALRPGADGETGFIQRWVQAVLFWDFPAYVFTVAYLLFAAVVGLTFWLLPPDRRHRAL